MEPQTDIFAFVIDHFVSEQEEMRAAAAFAAGKQFWIETISLFDFSV